jgi:hypothetical protein
MHLEDDEERAPLSPAAPGGSLYLPPHLEDEDVADDIALQVHRHSRVRPDAVQDVDDATDTVFCTCELQCERGVTTGDLLCHADGDGMVPSSVASEISETSRSFIGP